MTEYKLSRGKVLYSRDSAKTNVYGIRIIPDMDDMQETNLLPAYPAFFSNSLEVYSVDDVVWCYTTEDFQIGYVLGLCETPEGKNISSLYDKIVALEKKFNLSVSQVQNISFHLSDGILLDFSDKELGINGRLTTTGSSFIFTSDGSIFMDTDESSIHLNNEGEAVYLSTEESHIVDQAYEVKASSIEETANSKRSNISGDNVEVISGSSSKSVLGVNQEAYTKDSLTTYISKKKEVIGLGEDTKIGAGGSKTTILTGDYALTLIQGNVTITSGLGKMRLIIGPRGLEIISAGIISLKTPLAIKLLASSIDLKSIKLSSSLSIFGGGAFCAIPFCPMTGLPHTTNTFVGIPI